MSIAPPPPDADKVPRRCQRAGCQEPAAYRMVLIRPNGDDEKRLSVYCGTDAANLAANLRHYTNGRPAYRIDHYAPGLAVGEASE